MKEGEIVAFSRKEITKNEMNKMIIKKKNNKEKNGRKDISF